MSRKNTILIAAVINIGLLAVLFVTATKQDKNVLPVDPSAFLVENEMVDTALGSEEKDNEILIEQPSPIVHKLPEAVEGAKLQAPEKLVYAKQETHLPKCEKIVVKKGDSLDKIAKIYSVSVDDIVDANSLKTTIIRIGQVLDIPLDRPKKSSEKKPAIIQGEYYIVKSGDNPWTIAMKHNLKVEDLLRLNNLDKEKAKKLRPGDKLKIK